MIALFKKLIFKLHILLLFHINIYLLGLEAYYPTGVPFMLFGLGILVANV